MDVTIVGAGPVGSRTAEALARAGHAVQVFEEHPGAGRPEHCTGIVSPRLLELVKTKSVISRPERVRILGQDIDFCIPGKALVIDRERFDQERHKAAVRAGAVFHFNSRMRFDGTRVFRGDARVKADLCIGADGPRSCIRSYHHPPANLIPAAQYVMAGKFDPKEVEMHVWPHYQKPGLFTWVVPESRSRARIGTACANPTPLLDAFIKQRFPAAKIEKRMAGTVMQSGPLRQDYGPVKLVGDAAGHVKATTGGGLVPGLWCAHRLAESITHGKDYTLSCRPVLQQLKLAYWLRKGWDRLSGPTKERILSSLSKKTGRLEKTDMDWHAGSLISITGSDLGLLPLLLLDLLL